MKVTVLGSGTSHGVPVIGCTCAVCVSSNPRNKRLRPSILVSSDTGCNVLVDTPPEMRLAFLANGVTSLDAIFYTHSHADHVFGLDDVRTFNYRTGLPIPIYAEPNVNDDLRRIYAYIFGGSSVGGGKPQVTLNDIGAGSIVTRCGLDVRALRVYHGPLPILSFLFNSKFAYVTDVSSIPEETWPYLENLDVLMLDAVRREPHSTHFHLQSALDVIAKLRPKRALLTHLSHDYDHDATNAGLPGGVALAFDGQTFDVPS